MTRPAFWTAKVQCANPDCPDSGVERTISFAQLGDGVFHIPTTMSALGLSVWALGCGTCRKQMMMEAA